jgi:hypothetical protein
MAVANETGDKMRDLIAAAAADLEVDSPAAEGESDVDGGAGAGVDADADAAGAADADAAANADGVSDTADDNAAGAAADVEDTAAADAAAAATATADAAGAADAGKGAGKDKAKQTDDAFAKEHGLKAKDNQGRVNRIPYNVVRDRIVPNAVKKALATKETEWKAAHVAPRDAKIHTYEDRLNKIGAIEKIQFENPRRYVMMLQTIPGYKELFAEISGGKWTGTTENGTSGGNGTKVAHDADDPMPTPDARDAEGKVVGWTQEGIDKRFAWERRQAAKEAAAAIKAEFKPIQDRFATVQATEETAKSIDGIISLADSWPGFRENHQAILAEVAAGTDVLDTPQKMYTAVQGAYNKVMFGALTSTKETEEQRRARYFADFQKELKKAPRSTASRSSVARHEPATGDPHAGKSGDDRMRDLISESVKKAGLV